MSNQELLNRQMLLHQWVVENEAQLLPSSDELLEDGIEMDEPMLIHSAALLVEVVGMDGTHCVIPIRFPTMSPIHLKGLLCTAAEDY